MTSVETHRNVNELIKVLKSGERPLDRRVGQALEDVYASGKFRTAVLRGFTGGSIDVPQAILAVRLVTLETNGGIQSAVVSQPHLKHRSREFLDKLHRDLNSLSVDAGRLVVSLLPLLQELVTQQGLSVLAAQHLSQNLQTKEEIGAVLYPRVYRTLPLPFIPDSQRDSLGLMMASGVLKLVPFDRHNVSIISPAH